MSAYLTYEGRLEIEAGLKERRTFGEIGRQIGKDRTTVAKEVKRNAVDKKTGVPGYPYNACIHRKNCKKKNICGIECTRKSAYSCRLCSHCNTSCTDFKEEICTGLNKAPYVCNGCLEQDKCTLRKRVYLASDAQGKAEDSISNARSGILSSEEELLRLNSIISPLVENGQSVHQIYVNYKDELMCSEKTIYNYIDSGLFDVRNIDLPRKVKYRQRRKEKEFKVDRACRNGRTYEDFKKYMEKNPEVPLVQMDSVVGKKGGKVLLTVHFVDTSLMLAYIRDANTAKTVTDAFRELRKKLGNSLYKSLFPVILTDNGSEFSNPKGIEYDENGLSVSRVFYCDAGSPYQKGAIEVNHELIRRILPKGSSFDDLTQEDVNRMMDHINSYKRKKLNNRSPYEAFSFYYGETVLAKLGCTQVSPGEIILKPSLLK